MNTPKENTYSLLPFFTSTLIFLLISGELNISKHSKHATVRISFEVSPFTHCIFLCLNHSEFCLALPLIRGACNILPSQGNCIFKRLWKKLSEFMLERRSSRMTEPLQSSQTNSMQNLWPRLHESNRM